MYITKKLDELRSTFYTTEVKSHMNTGRELETRHFLSSRTSTEIRAVSTTRESILSGIWQESKQPRIRSITWQIQISMPELNKIGFCLGTNALCLFLLFCHAQLLACKQYRASIKLLMQQENTCLQRYHRQAKMNQK